MYSLTSLTLPGRTCCGAVSDLDLLGQLDSTYDRNQLVKHLISEWISSSKGERSRCQWLKQKEVRDWRGGQLSSDWLAAEVRGENSCPNRRSWHRSSHQNNVPRATPIISTRRRRRASGQAHSKLASLSHVDCVIVTLIFHVEDQDGSFKKARYPFQSRNSVTIHIKTSVRRCEGADTMGSAEEIFLRSTPSYVANAPQNWRV